MMLPTGISLSLKRKSSFKRLSILSLFNPSLQLINGFIGVSLPVLSSKIDHGFQNLPLRKNKESCLRDATESIFSKLFDEPDFDGSTSTPSSIGNKSSSQSSSVSEDEDDNNNSTGAYTPQKKTFYKSNQLRQSTSPRRPKKNSYDGNNYHLSSQTNTDATIRSCLVPLIHMMRPGNFPGVILFHVRKLYIYYLLLLFIP